MEYLTISKLAEKAGVSTSTARRYAQNYSQFFKETTGELDGYKKYPAEETTELIRALSKICESGKRKATVIDELKAAGFKEIEKEAAPEPAEKTPDDCPPPQLKIDFSGLENGELGPKTLEAINRLAAALEKNALVNKNA